MKQFSYSERDDAFGQAMLGLRTAIGLTQAGLAELLGVSRKAVSRWEAGDSYPKAEHLKALLAFAVRQQAFAAGREEEEIRAFWRAWQPQPAQWRQRWEHALVGPAVRGVRAGAKGASGCGPVAERKSRWEDAGK